ncbi:cullin-1-like [Papaver somniferum]|uniref:cullin-1-like n=1 Tax=Papaver somniferum TaxID=3469 RepID=UPI000E6FB9F2|nr:cullin-1-like [Papaver somniferum]
MDGNIVELEEGWEIIQNGIKMLVNTLEGVRTESPMFASIYTTVFIMCTQIPPHKYFGQFYKRYQRVYNDYLRSKVLPAIQEKQQQHSDDVSMLQELVKRWANHKVMVTKLSHYFNYLDRQYIPKRMADHGVYVPGVKDVGFGFFHDIVYAKMKVKVRDVVIALINQERRGNEIDRSLVKDVLDIFVEIGNENDKDKLDYYVNDFETAFLSDMVDYYTRKGSNEITAIECL